MNRCVLQAHKVNLKQEISFTWLLLELEQFESNVIFFHIKEMLRKHRLLIYEYMPLTFQQDFMQPRKIIYNVFNLPHCNCQEHCVNIFLSSSVKNELSVPICCNSILALLAVMNVKGVVYL